MYIKVNYDPTKVKQIEKVSQLENDSEYISYFDLYLKDKNGDYIIDEDNNYIIECHASFAYVENLQKQINELHSYIEELQKQINELRKN